MTETPRYRELYRATIPSVVSVYLDEGRAGGAGSGFVYAARDDGGGYLVTNEHVVRESEAVDVRFSDGEWRVGEVAGTDACTDPAIVSVPDRPADAPPRRPTARRTLARAWRRWAIR